MWHFSIKALVYIWRRGGGGGPASLRLCNTLRDALPSLINFTYIALKRHTVKLSKYIHTQPVNLCKTPSVYSNKIIHTHRVNAVFVVIAAKQIVQLPLHNARRCAWSYERASPNFGKHTLSEHIGMAAKCSATTTLLAKKTPHINIAPPPPPRHKCNNYVVICEIAKTLKNINIRTNHLLLNVFFSSMLRVWGVLFRYI